MKRWFLVALLSACGDPETLPLEVPEGCQLLLGGLDCLLPYPSNAFLVPEPSFETKARVLIPEASRLLTNTHTSADAHDLLTSDGFSTSSAIGLLLASPPRAADLVGWLQDQRLSTELSSKTQILEAASATPIAHFVDVDPLALDPAKRAVVLHPLAPLQHATRYVVVVQDAKAEDGSTIPAPEGFRRLRDAEISEDLESLSERFERDVFPVIEKRGIPRSSVTLAFDFTTGSRTRPEADLVEIRRRTLEWLTTSSISVSLRQVTEIPAGPIARVVEGTFTAPLFVDSLSAEARIPRDALGQLELQAPKPTPIPFRAQIPRSVVQSGVGRPLLWGHGFFGRRSDVDGDAQRKLADELGLIMFAIDWWGFSRDDVFVVTDALVRRPNELLALVDRIDQAVANWIVFAEAIRGPLRDLPAFAQTATTAAFYGANDRIAYLGSSAGHILGGTLAAVHPTVHDYALNVGGGGFANMMFRAQPFAPLLSLLSNAVPNALDQQKYVLLLQESFDRVDPAFWAPRVLRDPFPGNEDQALLVQVGLGDAQVPNVGSFFHARALGIPQLLPTPRDVVGLESVAPSLDLKGAMTLFDYGIPPDRDAVADPVRPQNRVHDSVLQEPSAHRQIERFLRSREIIFPCDGPCDPN